jgi:transposase
MNRGPKGRYTKEFREQAVKLVLVGGLSQREVAGRLSLSVKTLGAWVVAERKGTLTKVGETQKPQSELEAELARVKRELATVTMERDIHMACFCKQNECPPRCRDLKCQRIRPDW